MVHRRLSATGRNINFNANINYSNSKNKNVSANNVHLYQIKNQWGNDSTYQTNRYTMRPSENFSYSLQVTYTEPLLKNIFLQTSYQFRYNHTKSDPSTYDFDDMEESIYKNSFNDYRDWNTFFNSLDYPIDHYLDRDLSRYAEYTNISNDLDLQLRVIREKLNMNVGFSLRPERSHMRQNYMGRAIDTIRTVTNVAPSLNMTYRFTKKSNLRLNWRGSSSQPSITDLIDIRDDSNPLAIRTGNPGLKPSFTNNINARYNGQWTNRRIMTLVGNINFRTTSNNIRDKVTYNPITGGTVSRPENINGNWSISSGITFNTTLDTLMAWNINTSTDYSFNHNVGFVTLDRQSSSVRNVTRQSTVSERIGLSYRHKRIFNIDLDGRLNYSHARNELRPQSNLDTWNFSYGGSASVNLPWNMSITTNIHQHSRRGYATSEMNTNELLWNAQISQSFLRRRALTFTLQFYDLLNQQSNFSRSINENRRSDTEYNSIHSYVMLHVIYRLDLRGNKNDRREMRERHWPSNSQDDMKPSQRNGRSGNEYRRPPGGREGFERM